MTNATETKTFTKSEMINHFFTNAYAVDDAFILLPGQDKYQLVYDQTEQELDRQMSRGKIVNYVVFDHIMTVISDLDNFLTPAQLERVASEIEDF